MSRNDEFSSMPRNVSERVAGSANARMLEGAVSDASRSVLRNTYLLLALTLIFGGATAAATAALGLPHPGLLLTLGGYFGLLFLTHKLANSGWGLLAVFGLTGFLGYTLGPILSVYASLPNGPDIIATALGGTGVVFVGMSALALARPGKDYSALGKSLMVGILVAFVLAIAAYVFELGALALAVSAMFVVLMSGLILWETSNILNGGETNYILATVTLYVAIYHLFTSLMHLLAVFMGEDG